MARHSKHFYRTCALGLGERGKHANSPYFNRCHMEPFQNVQSTQRSGIHLQEQYSQFSDYYLFTAIPEIRWEIFNFLIAGGLALKLAEEISRRQER